MTKAQAAERENEREYLRARLNRGDQVFTILRKMTDTGMRYYDCYYMRIDGQQPHQIVPVRITYSVAKAIGCTYDRKNEAIRTTDDDHGIVHHLSMALFCPNTYDHEAAFSLKRERLA